MQLTRAADYGIRAMVYLASLTEGERARLPSISAATGVPLSFLSKVLQTLAHAHMIASWRGKMGGFQALPLGRKATLRQLIEAIDGRISLNACVLAGDNCQRKAYCPAHPVWLRAQHAMMAILNTATIAELAARSRIAEPTPPANQLVAPTLEAEDRASLVICPASDTRASTAFASPGNG